MLGMVGRTDIAPTVFVRRKGPPVSQHEEVSAVCTDRAGQFNELGHLAKIQRLDDKVETQQINVETFRGFEAATATTVLYILIAMAVIGTMTWLQPRRFDRR